MIILSSDYDGTLNTRILELRKNIRELKRYRELGNIFVLNTGRSYESIMHEVEEYGIPFDYLCCNDGAVVFDEHLDVVNETNLTERQKNHIKSLTVSNPSFKIGSFYSAKEKKSIEIEHPIEIEVVRTDDHRFEDFIRDLDPQNLDLSYFQWHNSLYIKNQTSKSRALDHVIAHLGSEIDSRDIYTIGDEGNDLEMIQNHRGFRMLESSPKLWFKTWRVVPEVYYLLKYLNLKSKFEQRAKQKCR